MLLINDIGIIKNQEDFNNYIFDLNINDINKFQNLIVHKIKNDKYCNNYEAYLLKDGLNNSVFIVADYTFKWSSNSCYKNPNITDIFYIEKSPDTLKDELLDTIKYSDSENDIVDIFISKNINYIKYHKMKRNCSVDISFKDNKQKICNYDIIKNINDYNISSQIIKDFLISFLYKDTVVNILYGDKDGFRLSKYDEFLDGINYIKTKNDLDEVMKKIYNINDIYIKDISVINYEYYKNIIKTKIIYSKKYNNLNIRQQFVDYIIEKVNLIDDKVSYHIKEEFIYEIYNYKNNNMEYIKNEFIDKYENNDIDLNIWYNGISLFLLDFYSEFYNKFISYNFIRSELLEDLDNKFKELLSIL